MRGRGAIAACVGLALLVAGCNTLERNFLRDGVGTDVPSADIVATTDIQDIYFGELCRQAGLNVVRRMPNGPLLCDEDNLPQGAWTIFVQAGMNDIDRRCDAYLAWLDDRRRWREPFLKQLHSTAAVTAAVMGLTGVGATPIAIVGAAFGFAQETFVNLSGRLVTEINQSTVQSLVLTRQNAYRGGLGTRVIPNRPAALYALRSYLRICMPMTIETEINVTMTGVDRNGDTPDPMITPQTILRGNVARTLIDSIPQGGPRGNLPGTGTNPPPPPREPKMAGGSNDTERNLVQSAGQSIQANLCAPPTGTFDDATKEAIRQAKIGGNSSASNATPFNNTKNVITTPTEAQIFLNSKFCSFDMSGTDRGYRTSFEKFRFADETAVKSLQTILGRCDTTLKDKESGKFDPATRAAIKVAKGKISASRRAELADADSETLSDKSFTAISLTCRL